LYFYDQQVTISPPTSNHTCELEITDVNNVYLKQGELNVELMGRAARHRYRHPRIFTEAGQFVATIEAQGLKVACLKKSPAAVTISAFAARNAGTAAEEKMSTWRYLTWSAEKTF
jgi:glucose-1-phosphate thymidylyltransferase